MYRDRSEWNASRLCYVQCPYQCPRVVAVPMVVRKARGRRSEVIWRRLQKTNKSLFPFLLLRLPPMLPLGICNPAVRLTGFGPMVDRHLVRSPSPARPVHLTDSHLSTDLLLRRRRPRTPPLDAVDCYWTPAAPVPRQCPRRVKGDLRTVLEVHLYPRGITRSVIPFPPSSRRWYIPGLYLIRSRTNRSPSSVVDEHIGNCSAGTQFQRSRTLGLLSRGNHRCHVHE